jgi:hypothetical protein
MKGEGLQQDSNVTLTTLSIVATLLWLLYSHLKQDHSEEVSLDHIGQNLTCDVGSLASPQSVKLHRPQPVRQAVIISHPFRRAPSKKSVTAGHSRAIVGLTRDEIRTVSIGLRELKAVNRTVNKFYYFASTESYEKAKIANRKFRKRAARNALTSKLTPIYEDIAY